MSDVSNSIRLNDYMSSTLRTINQTMEQTIGIMQRLDTQLRALGSINDGGFSGMETAISAVMNKIMQLEAMIASIGVGAGPDGAAFAGLNTQLTAAQANTATLQERTGQLEDQTERLGHQARNTGEQFGGWALKLTGVFSALQMVKMGLDALGRVTDIADEFTNANARVNLINDGLRTQAQLQQQVLDSANNTRTSYTATAALVARVGRSGAFRGDNDSAIRFADIINKSLIISGAGTAEASSVTTQLSQAMSSGVLRGEEFNAIMENGSRLAEALATELGVTIGGLRQMAMDGQLTAEVVADAIMRAGETIDAEFGKMPRTFGQNMEIMRNVMGTWLADMAKAEGALGKINQIFEEFVVWLTSEDGNQFLDTIGLGLGFVILLFTSLIEVAQMVLPSVNEVFGMIAWGIEGVIAIFDFLVNLMWAGLPLIVAALGAYAAVWVAIDGRMLAHLALTTAVTTATNVLKAAKAAWAAVTLGVANAQFMLNLALSLNPIAIVVGLLMTVIAAMLAWQLSLHGLRQTFSDVFGFIVDVVQSAINFVISAIDGLIGGFNKIGGFVGKILGFDYHEIGTIEYRADFSNFKSTGQDLIENFTMDDLKNKLQPKIDSEIPGMGMMPTPADIGNVDRVGRVGKIDDDVNIADEDMKMLMDLAIQNRVNQINLTVQTTNSPNVTQNNVINTELDLQTAVNEITTGVYDTNQVMVEQDY